MLKESYPLISNILMFFYFYFWCNLVWVRDRSGSKIHNSVVLDRLLTVVTTVGIFISEIKICLFS